MGELRTRKRGTKWEYSFEAASVGGKRKTVSRSGFRTKAEAIQEGTKTKAEYDNAGVTFKPAEVSYSDYLDYWHDNYVKVECRENTQRIYSGIIRIHIKPYLGMYKLKSITPAILQQHLNKLHANGLSRNYLSNIYGVLSGSFHYAVEPGHMVKENPMTYVKMPRCQHKKIDTDHKIITQIEFNKITERYPFGSTYHIVLMICYFTGTRIAECTGLTWDRVDLEGGAIIIDRILVKHQDKKWYLGETKTITSTRNIAIGDTLKKLLRNHKKMQLENRFKYGEYHTSNYLTKDNCVLSADNHSGVSLPQLDFVCTNEKGQVITPDSTRYCSKVINYELGIQFNFHALRHTHATMLIENGANMKDVQKRLGHSKLSTTMDTYVEVTEKMSKETVTIFENAVFTVNI